MDKSSYRKIRQSMAVIRSCPNLTASAAGRAWNMLQAKDKVSGIIRGITGRYQAIGALYRRWPFWGWKRIGGMAKFGIDMVIEK